MATNRIETLDPALIRPGESLVYIALCLKFSGYDYFYEIGGYVNFCKLYCS